MDAADLVPRYSRQMIVPAVGGLEGQRKLKASSVLVVGAGGIGSTVLPYLAAAGIGRLQVVDFDTVEVSNLHRQILHDTASQGRLKGESAVARLMAINPTIECDRADEKLTASNALSLLADFDLVVDATDNFEARYVVNDACVLLGKPLVSGSAVGLEGQVTVYAPRIGPCYRCVYPAVSLLESCRSCANAGVLGPVPGLIGCVQAAEVIKVLLSEEDIVGNVRRARGGGKGVGGERGQVQGQDLPPPLPPPSTAAAPPSYALEEKTGNGLVGKGLRTLVGRQVFYDAAAGEFHNFILPPRNRGCAVCGDAPTIQTMADCGAFLDRVTASAASAQPPPSSSCGPCASALSSPSSSSSSTSPSPAVVHVSPAAYYRDVCLQGLPHVLIDVRSPVQFHTVSFDWYRSQVPPTDAARAQLIAAVTRTARLVHVPLSDLKRTLASADAPATVKSLLVRKLLQQQAAVGAIGDATDARVGAAEGPPVYVLCRRGIDSVTAAQLLLDGGLCNVHNIEGGLTAWHAAVDEHFPIY